MLSVIPINYTFIHRLIKVLPPEGVRVFPISVSYQNNLGCPDTSLSLLSSPLIHFYCRHAKQHPTNMCSFCLCDVVAGMMGRPTLVKQHVIAIDLYLFGDVWCLMGVDMPLQ